MADDPSTDTGVKGELLQLALHNSSRSVLLQLAAVLTLIGLALMVWSILQPTPLPVMLAMSVGQAIGSCAFGLYLFVVIRELRREYRK